MLNRFSKPKGGVGKTIYFLFFCILFISLGFMKSLKIKNIKDHFEHMCCTTVLYQIITSA